MNTDLIPESEAAILSGLSIITLSRFANAGYLSTREEKDGTRLFSKDELESVFGLKLNDSRKNKSAASNKSLTEQIEVSRTTSPSDAIDSFIMSTRQKKDEVPADKATAEEKTKEKTIEITKQNLSFRIEKSEESQALPSEALDKKEEKSIQEDDVLFFDEDFFVDDSIQDDTPPLEVPETKTREELLTKEFEAPAETTDKDNSANIASPNIASPNEDSEIAKLKNVIALQEQILNMKETEIGDLQGQRNWLRERIEKLEEKADRDQLLLLSETQMISRMVTGQKKRSPVVLALEWLGIRESKNDGSTIEIK